MTRLQAQPKAPLNDSVNREVSELVLDYLKRHPKMSVRNLAAKCGLPESTLRRMIYLKIKTIPDPARIVGVLLYIHRVSHLRELEELSSGNIKKFLQAHFGFLTQSGHSSPTSNKTKEVLASLLQDRMIYLVYTLATHRGGVSRDQIKIQFGQTGIQALDLLITEGFLKLVGDTASLNGDPFKHERRKFVQNFGYLASLLHTGKPDFENLYAIFGESLNENAYAEILQIQREALLKVAKIVEKPESQGDVHFFLLSAFDRYF